VHDYLSLRRLSPLILRAHCRRVALVLANSTSVAEDVGRMLPGTPIATVYNAIDLERFAPEGPRLDLDLAAKMPPAPDDVFRIGIVATYARWKGQDVLLRALAALPDRRRIRGYVIGGPVYQTAGSQWSRGEIEALVRELGLEHTVGLIGWLDDPSSAYRALDAVVHASTKPEPFGLSIAEAMACGRATVIAAAGGTLEIGDPGLTCVTHPPGDASALAQELERLRGDSRLRSALGKAAAERMRERFTRARLAAALGAAYASVVTPMAGAA
jgi:glycosyltransferase involved in cell wall biosynthesis